MYPQELNALVSNHKTPKTKFYFKNLFRLLRAFTSSISSSYRRKINKREPVNRVIGKNMTKKADSPRTGMKVPVPFRDLVRKNAQKSGMNMLDYLVSVVPKEDDYER